MNENETHYLAPVSLCWNKFNELDLCQTATNQSQYVGRTYELLGSTPSNIRYRGKINIAPSQYQDFETEAEARAWVEERAKERLKLQPIEA